MGTQENVSRIHDDASARDRALVEEFQSGSRTAYDMIYRAYRPRVEAACRRYLSDEHDVEDAVQDTFAKAFIALNRFNGQFRLGAWLGRIAANVSIDKLRRKSRSIVSLSLREDWDEVDPRPTADVLALHESDLHDVLDLLRSDHVIALRMRAEGYSHEEIGAALGRSPARAKALLHRARVAFKKTWTKIGTGVAVMAQIDFVLV